MLLFHVLLWFVLGRRRFLRAWMFLNIFLSVELHWFKVAFEIREQFLLYARSGIPAKSQVVQ